jgi:LacI family transcriptional regulator
MLRPIVNQKLIAKQLKLSPATVSKSFRNHPDIKPETRARVLDHAARLGYHLELNGRSTRFPQPMTESRFFAVLIHDNHGPGFRDFAGQGYVTGLSEAAARFDVSLIVHRFSGDSRQILDPAHQPPAMRRGALEGLILIHRYDGDVVRELAAQIPCLTLTFFVPGAPCDHIDSNHIGAMSKLVGHLHNLGHRRIGYVGHPNRPANSIARFGAFAQAMARYNLSLDLTDVVNVYGAMHDWDAQADLVQMRSSRGVTAWVCSVDTVGYELQRRLKERGILVPEHVSVTGYDADEPMYGLPALTSVRVPFTQMGSYALSRLIERIEIPSMPLMQVLFDCEVVPGHSSGPVRLNGL